MIRTAKLEYRQAPGLKRVGEGSRPCRNPTPSLRIGLRLAKEGGYHSYPVQLGRQINGSGRNPTRRRTGSPSFELKPQVSGEIGSQSYLNLDGSPTLILLICSE